MSVYKSKLMNVESRLMNVHAMKSTENFTLADQKELMGRYLTMKNKLGINHYRPELEGLREEKDHAK